MTIVMGLLTGCGEVETVSGIKINPEHELQPWSASEATSDGTETVSANPMAITAADLSLQDVAQADINLLGIREVDDSDGATDGIVTALLEPGKEYEITAQIMLTLAESADGEEAFEVRLEFPNLLLKRGTDQALTAQVCTETGSVLTEDFFQLSALAYDMVLEYTMDTLELGRIWSGNETADYQLSTDATWECTASPNEDVSCIICPIKASGWTTAQYLLRCRIRATVADERQAELSEHANNPVTLEFLGFSQGDTLGDDADVTNVALVDCLREDYFLPEELSFPEEELSIEEWGQQAAFLVAEVNLPEWAYREAAEQGLSIEQYSHPGSETGRNYSMRVILEGYPDNCGTAIAEIAIPQEVAGNHGFALSDIVPVTPLAIWKSTDDSQSPPELIGLRYLMNPHYDLASGCEVVCYQMSGAEVEQSEGHFYLVIGYGLDFSEGGITSPK